MAKSDRRVIKTKATLKENLILLIKEKSIKEITVKELCEKSDINRGTFYLHYKDVFDMLEQIENEMFLELNKVLANLAPDTDYSETPILIDIFKYVAEHKDMCTVLLSGNGDINFMKSLTSLVHQRWNIVYGENKEAQHYFAFTISGCIGLIENWITGGLTESAEDMAKLAESIILNGIDIFNV